VTLCDAFDDPARNLLPAISGDESLRINLAVSAPRGCRWNSKVIFGFEALRREAVRTRLSALCVRDDALARGRAGMEATKKLSALISLSRRETAAALTFSLSLSVMELFYGAFWNPRYCIPHEQILTEKNI